MRAKYTEDNLLRSGEM